MWYTRHPGDERAVTSRTFAVARAPVAQRIEQWFPKPLVAGSTPARGTYPGWGCFLFRAGRFAARFHPAALSRTPFCLRVLDGLWYNRRPKTVPTGHEFVTYQEEAEKMGRQPKRDLRRKQQRHRKLRAVREHLAKTTSPDQRQRLIAKIKKISPAAPVPPK